MLFRSTGFFFFILHIFLLLCHTFLSSFLQISIPFFVFFPLLSIPSLLWQIVNFNIFLSSLRSDALILLPSLYTLCILFVVFRNFYTILSLLLIPQYFNAISFLLNSLFLLLFNILLFFSLVSSPYSFPSSSSYQLPFCHSSSSKNDPFILYQRLPFFHSLS